MKKFTLIFLLGLISSVNGWAQCSDLFFSEYIEGSSNNKALEIFNPTGTPINLDDYQIHRYNNGSSADPDSFQLAGMLASSEVYIIANTSADPLILAEADTTGAATFYNGDDALVLINITTGDTADVIGIVGVDPGSNWTVGTGATNEHTLVRMAGVNAGTTDWALSSTQWEVFPQNTYDSLGSHSMNPCSMGPSGTNCTTDIFFSEYIEGSSSNKALEIYNPMDAAVNLDDYEIHRFNNGASADPDTFELAGMLASTEVYVIANAFADATILAEADTTGSATFYNGDDALVLLNTATGDTVDLIGILGVDPGSNWPVGAGATGEFTLVRMASVNEGTTDWALSATQWEVFPQNTDDSLGAHTMNPCQGGPPSSGTNCTTDIFFSEYIEGSSNNKALEIYNPMDVAVNLDNYEIHRFNNGSNMGPDTFELAGMLASTEVYIIANPSADPLILAEADTTGAATFYNGDDALVLINSATGDTVDVIGIVGIDPGSSWPVGTGATNEHTLVRMASVNEGTTDWALSATQWEVFPQNTYDSLGAHTMNPCQVGPPPPPPTNCTTEIFFSEYIEGSSSNKALEIFNPMDMAVNLDDYEIHRFNNGASVDPDTFELAGMLASAEVYVIANASADPLIIAESDTTGSATFYNGDDALVLINTVSGDTVDLIGIVGIDPGSSWPVGSGATNEHTLVRMASVNEGTTDWALSSTQWEVFPQNTYDSLGSHSMNPCGPPAADPTVTFVPNFATASELDGTVSFSIAIMDPNMMPTSVSVEFDTAASTATIGDDFTWSDSVITFPAGSGASINLDVTILDDAITEQNETVVVNLVNPTNNAVIGNGVFTLTIEDNEYPVYPIGLITADADGDGLGDSLNVRCEIQGVVHGVDLQGAASTNLLFTVIDSTGGIAVFSGSDTSYTVLEGDEIIVRGSISHFNGLTQFSGPDTIILLSQGNPTVTPLVVTMLDETTESELVTLECVTIADTSQWPTGGGSANVDVTNGVDNFTIRIDGDVDVSGTPVPTAKYLTITGIGGQFDGSDPRTEGYQLLPRYMADVVELNPEVGFTEATAAYAETNDSAMVHVAFNKGNPEDMVMVTVTVDSSSTATQGTDFSLMDSTLNVSGCGDQMVALPLGILDDTDPEIDETIVLILTSVANATVTIDTITVTITGQVGIKDLLPASAIKLYPNPGKVNIRWESDLRIEQMTISNLLGQEIVRKANPDAFGQMNISTLPKGLYIIRMKTDKGMWTKKWMKE